MLRSVLVAVVLMAVALDASAQYDVSTLLPPIPRVEGPLAIRLIYPEPGMFRPGVAKNFVFGTVGTGGASLTINGDTVPVAPNGAFLAYMPMAAGRENAWKLIAWQGEERDTFLYSYRDPGEWQGGPTQRVRNLHTPAKLGTVTSGADTLASGSGIAYAAPTPTADRTLFLPRGARFPVLEQKDDFVRIDLSGEEAWVEAQYVTLSDASPEETEPGLDLEFASDEGGLDVIVPVAFTPFSLKAEERTLTLTLYNTSTFLLKRMLGVETGASERYSVANLPNDYLYAYHWQGDSTRDAVTLTLDMKHALWGFKAWYDADGRLVLRLRRPPKISSSDPLKGLKIMIDAGHPPRGATGPTGLTEADANLAIALRLEELLRKRGATVVMTRHDAAPLLTDTNANVELTARVDYAVAKDVDILISVHNNGFSDGVDPFEKNGTETFWYHDFSSDLARFMNDEIAEVTGVPKIGAKQRSLALVRPTWMPAVLTESLYMMHPQQEVALRDRDFIDRLARAHVRGLEMYVRVRTE